LNKVACFAMASAAVSRDRLLVRPGFQQRTEYRKERVRKGSGK
jgi:hypothetical protein